ncbi:MAG: type II toxin-antitoxin system Phd/YefM family antitoxin [Solirubrobacteraceae bacterium]
MTDTVGVAEAKRHFSDLLDRVAAGEQIVVTRRGRPAVVLAPPSGGPATEARPAPAGFAAIAGALADVNDLDTMLDDARTARARAKDRPAPDLG